MNDGIREIRCEELRLLAEQFPWEVSVIREMLDEVDEECLDEAA
jgi:hypothetical protein